MAQSMLKQRSRNWCFTAWEDSWDSIKDATKESVGIVSFWCYGLETCPDTKKQHWQGYMEFNNPMSLRSLKTYMETTIHWEVRKGSQRQAIQYCQKDGDYYAFGTANAQGKRSDLTSIKSALDDGASVSDIADSHFGQWVRYNRAFDKYSQMRQPRRTWNTDVHIIWGPTGTGKTRWAVDQGAAIVEVDKNGFMHNYENQPILLWDDFNPDTISREMFLRLTDRYDVTVNVKGGTCRWNPRAIYITTNYNPRDWYAACPAVRRRITTITFKDRPFVDAAAGAAGGPERSAATWKSASESKVAAEIGDTYTL